MAKLEDVRPDGASLPAGAYDDPEGGYGTRQYTEALVRSIVERATNGKKLTTEELLALETALKGSEDIRDDQLRQEAASVLENSAQNLSKRLDYDEIDVNQSLQRQAGIANQGYAADLNSDAQLGAERDRVNAADKAALDDLIRNDQYVAGRDQGAADQYAAGAGYARQLDESALTGLNGAGSMANAQDRAALSDLLKSRTTADAADAASTQKLDAANKAVRYIDPTEYGPDVVSTAAKSKADTDAIAAQKDVLREYEDLSNPGITANERYLKELSRQEEERDDRAALGAALRDLEVRGIRSGGAEIGALLGSAQNTAQTRMLRDMAANQQAQQRAEAARASRAALAGDLRDASFGEEMQTGAAADSTAQFNKAQSQVAARAADQLRVQQENDSFARAKDVNAAETKATGDQFSRAGTAYDAGTATNQAAYDRANQLYDATTDRTDTAFDRAGKVKDTQLGVDKNFADMAETLAGKQLDTNDVQFGRGVDMANAQKDTTQNAYDRYTGYEKDFRDSQSTAFDEALSAFDAQAQAQGVKTNTSPNSVGGGLDKSISYNELQKGKKDVEDDDDLVHKVLGF